MQRTQVAKSITLGTTTEYALSSQTSQVRSHSLILSAFCGGVAQEAHFAWGMLEVMLMRAYSLDLRQRVVAAVQAGRSHSVAARLFGVSRRTVRRYLTQLEQTQQLTARPIPERARSAA